MHTAIYEKESATAPLPHHNSHLSTMATFLCRLLQHKETKTYVNKVVHMSVFQLTMSK